MCNKGKTTCPELEKLLSALYSSGRGGQAQGEACRVAQGAEEEAHCRLCCAEGALRRGFEASADGPATKQQRQITAQNPTARATSTRGGRTCCARICLRSWRRKRVFADPQFVIANSRTANARSRSAGAPPDQDRHDGGPAQTPATKQQRQITAQNPTARATSTRGGRTCCARMQTAELQTLAREVQELLQTKIGTTAYSQVHNTIRQFCATKRKIGAEQGVDDLPI
jgi:hypothetical protein